jgi:formylglycine-generating enzyme required for sulfatase activity
MGSEEGATWEKPVHRVDLSGFSIGRLPVTNAEFRAFRPEHHSPIDDRDEVPVTGVTWEDATAYCQWLSAKRERASRGGLEQKKYPWGDDPPVPPNRVDDHDYRPDPRPNPFAVIAGTHNLWEWVADHYDPGYFNSSPARDPKGPSAGEYRVLRGGGYPGDYNSVRCYSRGSARPRTS